MPGDGITVDALVGGNGPPLLLLHGYPQTRMIWRMVAPSLAEHFTLVMPDLRGYGRSDKPAGDGTHLQYSKRQMARDQIATMSALGHDKFFVAGHDRGARVAYRLALDSPQAVRKLCVMDILPTVDVYNAGPQTGFDMYHWYFLAQPAPLPETLIAGSGDHYIHRKFQQWSGENFNFPEPSMADYIAAFRNQETLRASCDDYRAGWHVDRILDAQDRTVGRQIKAPTLVLWGREGTVAKAEPMTVWRKWCKDITGQSVTGAHFVPEEAPRETSDALMSFFRE
ncbi:alpha/beta fold hydrolase [Croceicoccus mobilis]|uniref:alpha/beta fold hydrolase n=1 Tax=Croceicoccus mobilis TaxID=1703339 RepID=UPI00082BD3A6|nr:alpha/beta hydrolase [Croceicoccus mobilis]